jgi:RNA polymerase sigma-70 factor (ECF subfamily)
VKSAVTYLDSLFQSLYEANYKKMVRFAYCMVGSMETAQDLVQETFLLALFKSSSLSSHPNPEGWLMLTLKNLTRNEKRRMEHHPKVPLSSAEKSLGEEPDLPFETVLPRQLSPAEKEILTLRFEQQMDYPEISEKLGISESGCRSRLSRALAHYRELSEREGGHYGLI